ncbi:MAG: efflux RND transporter permease subunit [Proteobacteria bacterium]|nr:efflux RND transporter permease subunit [Pseudomonadota bacterium]MBS0567227.1 efflux RND transporter permease subunit [Pseudomonadota bacterium]
MNIVELATRRRVTVGMVTLTFVLFGLIALTGLKVNLLPDLTYPTLTVRTEYEGAAPLEIENLISQPVEEAIGVVKNLRKIHSVSRTGQSDVILEFAWGTNMDQAGLDVRDKLDTLQLPLDAKKPVLLRFNPSTDPIMRLSLSQGTGNREQGAGKADAKPATAEVNEAQLKQLRRFADDELKKRLEPTAGVAAVKVGGGLEDQVDVDIDQQKLRQLNLNIADVTKRLTDENVNVSGGRIENGSQRYLVRTVNQFTNLDEMRNLLIKVDNGVPVRLKDIADVKQGFKEREGIVRVDGHEAIELAIYKEGDANTVSVAAAVKKGLAKLKDILPPNAKLDTIDDQSIFIQSSLDDVRNDAVIGGVLAILIIFFFLADSWSTFIISLSLPISLITTFFFMGQANVSLNVMSLGGLALATGMVVDDSIVVLENIARMREHGASILEASVKGAKEVSMAVIASTLTTVAVFFPLVFVQGVGGQLFRDQALTVTFAMLISLVVAMTLIPMLASLKGRAPLAYREEEPSPGWQPTSRPGRTVKKIVTPISKLFFQRIPRLIATIAFVVSGVIGKVVGKVLRAIGRFVMIPYNAAARSYHALLPQALAHPVLVLGFAALAFIASLLVIPTLGMDLIPQLAQGRFEMTVKLPPGTALNDTDALVKELETANAKDPNIELIYGVSGTGTRLDATPTESGENIARLLVVLKHGAGEKGERAATDALRASMKTHPGAEVKFSRPQLFSFATPLEIELRGYDLASLEKAGKKLTNLMNASDRFADVKSTVEGGYPEIQIRFDQDRAAAFGLTTKQIADQVVNKVKGSVATRYSFRDRKIDVLVRAQENQRGSVDDIRNLIVGFAQSGTASTSASNSGSGSTSAMGSSGAASTVSSSGGASTGTNSNSQSTTTNSAAAGTPIRLSAVADVVSTIGPSEIHRISQERVAIVSANLHYGDLGTAVAEVRKLIRDNPLAAGVTAHIGGQSEELDASTNSLIFALVLAIFLVYLVMASQFESLLHPFVIMFSIPLALVGAVLALKLTFTPLSVVVFIGLIMLAGIVVKNAIVLIDRVNQLREEGVAKVDALTQAAESRLRPITMTTLCTLIGFLPLAIGLGDGSEVRAPMAITVIGGLAISTLLTLVVIPVVYTLLDRRSDAVYRERGERKARAVLDDAAVAPHGATP